MKILIADDHALVREGIIELLRAEFEYADIHEAENGCEVLLQIHDTDWDLILLDISMPLKNGLDALREIREKDIRCPILMLSMQPADQYAMRSIRAGASGYVNKGSAFEELVPAIYKVLSGDNYVPVMINR